MNQHDTRVLSLALDSMERGRSNIDRVQLEHALVQFGGFFWYRCEVSKGSPAFQFGDRSRAGWVLFVPEFKEGRILVDIYGLRLASSHDSEPCAVLNVAIPWWGAGELVSQGAGFAFKWTSDNYEHGTNEETLLVDPLSALWPGTFVHLTKQKDEVRGEVRYERMESSHQVPKAAGIPWLPVDIDPKFREGLPPEVVTSWGERLYRALQDDRKPTDGQSIVLLDIVSRDCVGTSRAELIATRTNLVRKHGYMAIYIRNPDQAPLSLMGPQH